LARAGRAVDELRRLREHSPYQVQECRPGPQPNEYAHAHRSRSQQPFVLTRNFDAPRKQVLAAFTQLEQLQRWSGMVYQLAVHLPATRAGA